MLDLDEAWLCAAKAEALRELERRRALCLAGQPPINLRGRVVISADDGIATGATIRAALHSVRQQGASLVVVAVPVASRDALAGLELACDEIVYLQAQADFMAVGEYQRNFPQLAD